MTVDVRREVLRLLKEDEEFKYTVAGYIGLSEILKRLDTIEKNIENLWMEVRGLREGQNKLFEEQKRLWEEVRSLREGQNKLWEGQERLWEEGQNKLWEEVRDMRITLNRVAVPLDRLTISVEEEGLSFVKHRVKSDLGLDIELGRVFVDSREIDIYGAAGDVCVFGEATARLGASLVEELLEKIESVKPRNPQLLRKKIIKVIYTDYATPDALQVSAEKKIWVLKWSGDLTPLIVENG